jgi:hypothetical protein
MNRNERWNRQSGGERGRARHRCLSVSPRILAAFAVAVLLLPLAPRFDEEPASAQGAFSFALTADVRAYAGPGTYDTSSYFRGVMEAIDLVGEGAFMVSPGDIDPPDDVNWTIKQVLGTAYLWYPVVGNHEEETASDMVWLRAYDYDQNGAGTPPDTVNAGPAACPETTYSFDYANVHFAVLNQYCDTGGDDVTAGDVPDYLYNWLVADLQATAKEHIFVVGHEPAYPQPDADSGRIRHVGDSLDQYPANRDRFWELLRTEGVVAYLCGHTHNFSAVRIDGVWQLDAGHSRGAGDTGAASTFTMVHVDGDGVTFDTYRDDHDGVYDYDDILHSGTLTGGGTEVSLFSKGDAWRYLDDGSDQGTAWRGPHFDDGAWASGPTQLGYGDGDEATVVEYGPYPNNKYVTTYFRRTFHVDDTSEFASLTLGIVRDDGAVVHLNGTEVYRTNMPAGMVDYLTTASSALGGAAESATNYVAVDPSLMNTGDNILAVEIHQANPTSSDISFDLELKGTAFGLTPRQDLCFLPVIGAHGQR